MQSENNSQKSQHVVSVVSPFRGDLNIFKNNLSKLSEKINSQYEYYEIIIVGSGEEFHKERYSFSQIKNVRVLVIGGRQDEEVQITAGLDTSVGDAVCVVSMIHDPSEAIIESLKLSLLGEPIVVGIKKEPKNGFLEKVFTNIFHAYASYAGLRIPKNTTGLFCMDRNTLSSILRFEDRKRFLRVFASLSSFKRKEIVYQQNLPELKERSLIRKFWEGVEIIVSNSRHPLRFAAAAGVVISFLNFLYIFYVIGIYLFRSGVAEGWTTTSLQVTGMFFFLFLFLSVLAEYIGRILEETQRRPLYSVVSEVLADETIEESMKANIVK